MVQIADLSGCRMAFEQYISHFAARHTDNGVLAFLCHKLRGYARRSRNLTALAGILLYVVNNGTHGDCFETQTVARLDVGFVRADDGVADGETDGSQNISLFAVGIVQKRDVGGAVGVIFD